MGNETPSLPESPIRAPITDFRRPPPGVMPRNLQRWVLVGVSIVMVSIMALSGRSVPPRATASSSAVATVDPNQQRIEDYQRRIEDQAQRLVAEQAALQAAKASAAVPSSASPGRTSAPGPNEAEQLSGTSAPGPEQLPPRDRSLFADNVAFSRQTRAAVAPPVSMDVTGPPVAAGPRAGLVAPTPAAPHSGAEVGSPASAAPPQALSASAKATSPSISAPPDERTYQLPEGTIIETVLTNRLDGTYAGPVNCLVTTAVYAPDREHLLIPAGARVLGEARAVTAFGQSRLAVTFHRLLLPNGRRVNLETFHGLNQVGQTGLRDEVDRHYAEMFGASLAVGAIAGFAQAQTTVGLDASALDAYRQNAATSLAQSSARILDRFLNLLPTVTIREGHRIKVYLSDDVDLPAYREPTATTGGHP